ncbi:hypothetical protein KAU09_01480 [Candidatus Parcubacteria bacterium]|nr:hypothetical protein [Candidatus Parcubacteria bacterium]
MNKKLKSTKSDIIKKGDYLEAIIHIFKNKPQISAVFLGWDTMINGMSVRFFNLKQSAPLAEGEAWLFKVMGVNNTREYLNSQHKDREIIIFSIKPIGRIIDSESAYYDLNSSKWVETFKCGDISRYKETKIPAEMKTRLFKHEGMLHKLDIITDVKTDKMIQLSHFAEYTPEEFLEESQRKLGRGITQVSLKNIPEIPAEWLGKIKHFPTLNN